MKLELQLQLGRLRERERVIRKHEIKRKSKKATGEARIGMADPDWSRFDWIAWFFS